MADIIKKSMADIWASSGDIQAPEPAKISTGWVVEAVPRQWWNWFENRQDTNIAYMLQKGIPEWDATTEYIINKSYVQRNGIVYKATATNTDSDPVTQANWVRAFSDYSAGSAALGSLTPAANQLPYFTGANSADTTTLSPFVRTILDDVDAASVRDTISAQQSALNLSSLSAVTAVNNGLPYFTGANSMAVTDLTAFGRSLIATIDAVAARSLLGVDSSADTNAALVAGLATKQPLSSSLTTLSAVTPGTNKLPYFTGGSSVATTDFTVFARTLLDDVDAASARSTLEVDSSATVASNLSAGLATKQPLNSNLTALSSVTPANNTMSYWSGASSAATTPLTPFARTILDDADAATMRATLGVDSSATVAANLSAGLATKQPLSAGLTVLSFPSGSFGADQIPYFTSGTSSNVTTLTAFARAVLASPNAESFRVNIGSHVADNLIAGLIPLARIPTSLPGVAVSSANALSTARTIQGVPFNGTADISLPCVTFDSPTGGAYLPTGNTAQRPAAAVGVIRYNTQTLEYEGYQASGWSGIGNNSALSARVSALEAGYQLDVEVLWTGVIGGPGSVTLSRNLRVGDLLFITHNDAGTLSTGVMPIKSITSGHGTNFQTGGALTGTIMGATPNIFTFYSFTAGYGVTSINAMRIINR